MEMIAQTSKILERLFEKKKPTEFSFYTPQDQVMAELYRRRSLITDDSKLLEIIKPTPSIQRLIDKPHLVFGRHVATPLHETLRVIELAKELDLDLCIFEFSADKMVSANNSYKHGLAKLPVYEALDRNGNDIFHRRRLVDLSTSDGHPLSDVRTIHDESMIDFHHELFTVVTGVNVETVAFDFSDWLAQFNSSAEEYYEAFFTLFVKHNLMAEIFLFSDDSENQFTNNIVRPSFDRVINKHGLNPLVINYLPNNEQERSYWDCYPSSVDDFLQQKGYINK